MLLRNSMPLDWMSWYVLTICPSCTRRNLIEPVGPSAEFWRISKENERRARIFHAGPAWVDLPLSTVDEWVSVFAFPQLASLFEIVDLLWEASHHREKFPGKLFTSKVRLRRTIARNISDLFTAKEMPFRFFGLNSWETQGSHWHHRSKYPTMLTGFLIV